MKIVYLKVLSLKRSLPYDVMAFIIWSQLSMGLVQHWKSDTRYCKQLSPVQAWGSALQHIIRGENPSILHLLMLFQALILNSG